MAAASTMYRKIGPGLWILLLFLGLCGCSKIGSQAMHRARTDYNAALQQSHDEQLLENIVRLRYLHNPSFLEVGSITTQLSISADANVGFEYELQEENPADVEVRTDSFSAGGGIGFSSSPTITFTPLRGEEFLQRMLSPVTIERLMLLYNSGWSLKRVFRLLIQSINGIPNAKGASGPMPERIPRYEDFEKVIDLMRNLENRSLLELTFESYEKTTESVMAFAPGAWDTAEAKTLAELLGVDPGKDHYGITYAGISAVKDKEPIRLETRSFLGILFFLSHGVDIPEKDIDSGIVRLTTTEDGTPFDWEKVLRNSFNVHYSRNRPRNAAVSTYYGGNWFFIPENDTQSKSTLILLTQILALQSGKSGEPVTPILTIPAGR